MERITEKMLQLRVANLNKLKGFENAKYGVVNSYCLDYAYGGVSLHKYTNEHGGIHDVFGCGHVPKRDLFNRICAYMTDMY